MNRFVSSLPILMSRRGSAFCADGAVAAAEVARVVFRNTLVPLPGRYHTGTLSGPLLCSQTTYKFSQFFVEYLRLRQIYDVSGVLDNC